MLLPDYVQLSQEGSPVLEQVCALVKLALRSTDAVVCAVPPTGCSSRVPGCEPQSGLAILQPQQLTGSVDSTVKLMAW